MITNCEMCNRRMLIGINRSKAPWIFFGNQRIKVCKDCKKKYDTGYHTFKRGVFKNNGIKIKP